MRWRQWARLVIAVAGVGLAVVLYMQMHRRQPPALAAPLAPPAKASGAAAADYKGEGTEQVNLRNNKESSVTKSERVTHFPDGRTLTEKPHITFVRGDRTFEISADQGESRTKPGEDVAAVPQEVTLSGHVRAASSDGFTLTSDIATYQTESGVATIPGHAAFTRGRLSGSGEGARYDVDTLDLLDRAEIDTQPDAEGHGGFHASARTIVLTRPAHVVKLDDHAVIVRDGQTISTNQATVYLTDDDEHVKRMELRGQSSVAQPATPTAAAGTMNARDIDMDVDPATSVLQVTDLRGAASLTSTPTAKSKPPQMKAETIHIDFQSDGRAAKRAVMTDRALLTLIATDNARRSVQGNNIAVSLSADGQRATALNAQGTVIVTLPETAAAPGRVITGDTLEASGSDEKGLTAAAFKPAKGKPCAFSAVPDPSCVSLTERQKADAKTGRKATSRHLYAGDMGLVLNGDLGAIEEARFLGKFHFHVDDDETDARAGQGKFIDKTGELRLAGFPTEDADKPNVDNPRMFVTAHRIEMGTKSSSLKAFQGVESNLKPDTSKDKKASTGLFDVGQKMTATAEQLDYDDEKAEAKYSGGAHLWQGSNRIDAETVTMSNRTGNLTASGGVASVFLLDKSPGAADAAKPGAVSAIVQGCTVAGASCVNAGSMTYDDAHRLATYTTDATFIGSGDTAIKADVIKLTLAQEGRALDQVVAEGALIANFAGGSQAQGSRLTYTAGIETYVVTGVPLVIVTRSVDKAKETCTASTGRQFTLIPANDALKRTESKTLTDSHTRTVLDAPAASCTAVLKVIK